MLILAIGGGAFFAGALYISALGIMTVDDQPLPDAPAAVLEDNRSFPATVQGTSLIAQQLSSYEGPFVEDGSDREVSGVAALHVYNAGSDVIAQTQVQLQYGDTTYVFCGEYLLPGETTVLLERSAKPYRTDGFSHCMGWQVIAEQNLLNHILVTDRQMGTLIVKNLTDSTLNQLCLYYKTWLSPPEVYVGGIVYEVDVPELQPGETVLLYPNHYACGYSRVVFAAED